MNTCKVLVPCTFTANDEKGLRFVIATYGGRADVSVALFHAYTPVPEIDLKANPELRKLASGMVHLSSAIGEQERGLQQARRRLVEAGFPAEAVTTIFKKRSRGLAEEVIDTVQKEGFDVLVLSGAPARLTPLFTRGIHQRVLASLEGVTVCIAT